MGTLSYTATMSLDGYAADATGDFQWSAPGDEVFEFHIERMGAVTTEVLGRKTYQLMQYWDAEPEPGAWGDQEREFATRWQGITHVVASSTLSAQDLTSDTAELVAHLDLDTLQRIVRDAQGEVEIFGPTTASDAIRAGLVRDFRFFIVPKMVGGGLRAIPDGAELDLELVEQWVFDGVDYLHYRARNAGR